MNVKNDYYRKLSVLSKSKTTKLEILSQYMRNILNFFLNL